MDYNYKKMQQSIKGLFNMLLQKLGQFISRLSSAELSLKLSLAVSEKLFTLLNIIAIAFTTTLVGGLTLLFPTKIFAQTVDGSFSFSPTSGEYKESCNSSVNIVLDTGSNSSNAANIIIHYDPSQIDITDSDNSISGTQIQSGNIYEAYAENNVNSEIGEIRLTGFSIIKPFSGSGTFGTIHFIPKTSVTTVQFSIEFTRIGETLDSNIAETNSSNDILQSVNNASYSVVIAECVEDRIGPIITPVKPTQYEFLDCETEKCSEVKFNVCDSDSGVDINTVSAEINGTTYLPSDTDHFAYTTNNNCYNITVTLLNELPKDEAITAYYRASDFKGNSSSRSVVFNLPSGTEYITESIETIITERKECIKDLDNCETSISKGFIQLPRGVQTVTDTVIKKIFGNTEALPSEVRSTLNLIPLFLILAGLLIGGYYLSHWLIPFLIKLKSPKSGDTTGIVYSSKTSNPLNNTIIRLYSNGQHIKSVATNRDGEFQFVAPKSTYTITASKPGYIFPSSIVTEKSNSKYKNIYHGEPLSGNSVGNSLRNKYIENKITVDTDNNDISKKTDTSAKKVNSTTQTQPPNSKYQSLTIFMDRKR